MKQTGDGYWDLFWKTGLPEAYVMSRRGRKPGEDRPAEDRKHRRKG